MALSEEQKKEIEKIKARIQREKQQAEEYDKKLETVDEEYRQQKAQQSAEVASRLDGGNYATNTGKQQAIVEEKKADQKIAQVAARLDEGTYAQNTGKQAAIVQKKKDDQRSAQAAANLDNSLMTQATRDKRIEELRAAVDSAYNRLEGYKNNGQTEELAKAERQYKLLSDSLSRNRAYDGSAMEAENWETEQFNSIMDAGGADLMREISDLADLKAEVDLETQSNVGSEVLRLPSADWFEYQKRYNALRSRYGDEAAANMIAFAERAKNTVDANRVASKTQDAAKEMPVLTSALSVGTNMLGGLGYADVAAQRLQQAVTGSDIPIDYNRGAQRPAQLTQNIRQGVSEDMGDTGKFLYNVGMSMADTLAVMPTGKVGTAILGGAAATNAMQEAVQRGATDDQALMVGLVSGGVEALMEKASIDSLFKLKDAKNLGGVVLNVLKQGGAEAAEETLTTIANTIADAIIMGDESQLQTNKRNLMAQDISEDEAEKMVIQDWAINLGLDTLGGALSGGLFGAGKSVSNYANSRLDAAMPRIQQEQVQQTEQPQQATQGTEVDAVMPTIQQNKNAPVNETGAINDIKIEPSARTSDPENPAVQPVHAIDSSNVNIPNLPENVNRGNMGANPATGAADSGFDPYSHASIEHGAIDPGENPSRVVDVPKSMDGESNVMQTVRTIMEADATPDAAIPGLEQAVVRGNFSKMPITDQAAADRAESTISRVGYQQALADWRAEVRNGKVSKDSVVVGETLYNAAVNAGDLKSAVKIAVELSTQVRSAAQALQAVRMLKKMSPAAQLYGVKQSVDNLQDTLTKKYGKRAPDLVINEELAANFLAADTDADRTAAEEALYKDIARQIPATFADQWNAWRYLSMLGNVRTHVRNVSGNAMFAPVRAVKNKVGAGLEAGAQLVGIIDKSQRTKALAPAGRDLMKAAKADYQNVEKQVLSAGKYNSASDIIEENRRIFKNAVAETLRRGNSKLLDLEDSVFSKQAYAASLASYLKAQGFTAADFTGDGMTNQQKDAARAYAIKEAQKATYRDINDFSEAISSIGFKNPGDSKTKKVLNSAIEGVMPFKKTPANILVRGMEYSPAGLAKALSTDIYAVAKGKITAAEYMDRLASGLTGTGLFALGCFLSNSGVLVGGSPEDEDQAELEGRQPYSLEVGDKSITLDWLAPEAMPVFMGVELMEAIREGGGDAPLLDKVLSFAKGLSGPMLEMSMMSSLQDALEATEYADNKLLAFMANGALGYLKQALPTVFGQLERSLGNAVREMTFTQQGDKLLTKDAQYMVGSVANKIPGWDYNQIPYIDAWGRTEDQGNTGTRLFNNMLNPAYVSTIQETPVDAEIKRLETETGINLTPSRAQSILTIDGKKEILTANEYVTYAQAKGQNDLTFRQNLIDSDAYKALDDKTKVKAMEYSKDLANALAIKEAGFNDPNMPEWQKELIGADAETITRVLTEKAVDSQAGMLGENKYLGLETMLDNKSIDDQMALSRLSDTAQSAYTKNCENADISVQQFLDACGTAYAKGGTAQERKQAALDYIQGMDISAKQKGALAQAVHETIGTIAPLETQLPDQWLLDVGDTSRIEAQMGEDQKEKYDDYVKGSGVKMQTYLDMMEFYNSDEAKTQYDASGKAIDGEEARDHMEEYIRSLNISDAQKGHLYCGLYSQKTCPKDLLIAAFGTEVAEQYISDARKEGYEKYVKGTDIDLLTYFDLVSYYNSSESDGKKDANGKTIKGESKQDHVIAWIESLNIPNKDKGRLFCSLYAAKNCPYKWR